MSWIILGMLSAISAALVAIFGKIGIAHIDSTLATTVRAFIMAIFLLLVSLFLGKLAQIQTIDKKAFLFIALSGLAGAFSWFFYFWALKVGPAQGVAALDRMSVVFVIILAFLFLGESFTLRTGIAAALLASGAVLLVLK